MNLMRLKRCQLDERDYQLEWFSKLKDHSPRGLVKHFDGYSYEHVQGECPVRPERVPQLIQFCQRYLWSTMTTSLVSPPAYVEYCMKVARQLRLTSVALFLERRMLNIGLLITPCRCHGDMTLENVVMTNEWEAFAGKLTDFPQRKKIESGCSFILIDPGHDRGLPCRELDEAKIMQSLEELIKIRSSQEDYSYPRLGFLQGYFGEEIWKWYKEKSQSPVHQFLLATHYLRLLRHADKHPSWRIEHAERRLKELTNG